MAPKWLLPCHDVVRALSPMVFAYSATVSLLELILFLVPHHRNNLIALVHLVRVRYVIHLIYISSEWTHGRHHVAWSTLEEEPMIIAQMVLFYALNSPWIEHFLCSNQHN